jgi:flagella basal body P-ring formation protein FlgA
MRRGFILRLVAVLIAGTVPFPVSAQQTASGEVSLPVLARPMQVGQTIAPEDLDMARFPRALARDAIDQHDDLIGKELRRNIQKGRPITPRDVGEVSLVRRNQQVVMTYRSGTMLMTAQGLAMETGTQGEFIRVVNTKSRRTLRARVTGAGEVEVVD